MVDQDTGLQRQEEWVAELERLAATIAELRGAAGSVAESLRVAEGLVLSGQPDLDVLVDAEVWLQEAAAMLQDVSLVLGGDIASLDVAEQTLRQVASEHRAAAEQLRAEAAAMARRRELEAMVQEDPALASAVKHLLDNGLVAQAEAVVAQLPRPRLAQPVPIEAKDVAAVAAGPTPDAVPPPPERNAVAAAPASAEAPPAAQERTAASSGPEAMPVEDELKEQHLPAAAWDPEVYQQIVALLREGEETLAWLLAEAAGESALRCRALGLFATATGCDPADLVMRLADIVPEEAGIAYTSVDEARVILAACLRFGLTAGYSPLSLARLFERANLEQAPAALITAAIDAVQVGGRRPTVGDGAGYDGLQKEWTSLAGAARSLKQALARKNINYHRATMILHRLVKDGQPLGVALTELSELAEAARTAADGDERLERLRAVCADLHDTARVRRLIADADAAVSSSTQRRKPIVANAKTTLEDAIGEVRSLIDEALRLDVTIRQAGRQNDLAQLETMRRAVASYVPASEPRTVGAAALDRLVAWMAQDPAPMGERTVADLRRHAVRLVYEIDRDADGYPVEGPDLDQLRTLLAGRTVAAAVHGYLEHGNVAAATRLASEATGEGDAETLLDECRRARQEQKREHQASMREAEAALAKLRSVGLEGVALRLEARLRHCREPRDDRFDLTRGPLRAVVHEACEELRQYRGKLRARIDDVAVDQAVHARVIELLDSGDEVTTEEFLTLLHEGRGLPVEPSEQLKDDFRDFFPAVVDAAVRARSGGDDRDVIAEVIRHLGTDTARSSIIRDGILGWRHLRRHRRGQEAAFRRALADVLRMIGLVPAGTNWVQDLTDAPRTRSATLRVRAKPVDRSYVPQFGTQAGGGYNVFLMWDVATPGRLLSLIPERHRASANIILYVNVLTAEQRLQLRQLSSPGRDTGKLALVVDEAVMGWLATREEAAFRLTQRITLPFTSINPYTPFAGGDVPDEVFVGRDSERASVESPTGSMFVYGGRQLGKSALLRRVEKFYTDPPGIRQGAGHRVAVYLDLKSEGIGESRQPRELWSLLNRELKNRGVLPPHKAVNAGPQSVVEGVKSWLAEDEGNHLLLLLDEADSFLTADYGAAENDVRGRFPTLQRLKNLMEHSGRRFKPVFAGLHQVQRFYDSANTPVAHGGADILIGPLRPAEVRKLVIDPLRAIGYEFQTNELVWRVAALTNYQASLVQIFCEALVNHLRDRSLPDVGGRVGVTSADVDAVYADRAVRNLIAQRFRWTINLDNRYRVIAIIVALLSSDAAIDAVFDPQELHEYCATYWPAAFSPDVLRGKEFVRYLDEMIGLGILRRSGDSYGMRSPNVIALLGSETALNQELNEASVHFELPYEYNPTMSRRPLPITGSRRSPLTDADIADLIGERPTTGGAVSRVLQSGTHYAVALVTGSRALGIDRVVEVLESAAMQREPQLTFDAVNLPGVPAAIAADHSRHHRFLLITVPNSAAHPTAVDVVARQLEAAIAAIRTRPTVRAIVVLDIGAYPVTTTVDRLDDDADILRIPLRRWSAEGLRAWHDFPFDAPHERRRLYELTTGWPEIVEHAAVLAQERSTEDVLASLAQPFPGPVEARLFLAQAGLGDIVDELTLWARYCIDGDVGSAARTVQPITPDDLDAILEARCDVLVDRLDALGAVEPDAVGWRLDTTIAAAALVGATPG